MYCIYNVQRYTTDLYTVNMFISLFVQAEKFCSNLSYAFDYFELDDKQSYTYTLKFESDNRCEEAYEMLEYYNLPCVKDNCAAGGEIHTMMSRDTLQQVSIQSAITLIVLHI